MFVDPITITINAVAQVMNRVSSTGTSSVYQTADGTHKLTISHTRTRDKIRSLVRLDKQKVAADPLTAENQYVTLTQYSVFERPIFGFTQTEMEQLNTGFEAWVDNAVIGKLFGNES